MDNNNKDAFYYLVRDILSCFPNNIDKNLVSTLNSHFISKEAIRRVLIDELHTKNPQFRIIAGVLILQNNFLRCSRQAAFYEVVEVIQELKHCNENDKRKTIKKLSSEAILRLFASLYFEFIIIPSDNHDRKIYIDKFKKFISKKDIIKIIQADRFYARFIFQDHGIELETYEDLDLKLKIILDKFY